jgi:oxygen-independent coproporphyrinogen-3 oxidase
VRPIIDNGPGGPAASLYVHLPFCRERCLYCAFPTVADEPALHGPLIDAVLAEARRLHAQHSDLGPIETLYLGGGTPGLMPTPLLERLVAGLRATWSFQSDVEITLEANPTNVSMHSLSAWEALGVTRLSVGVQTLRDDVLARLGRRHDSADAQRALGVVAASWRHTWSADLLAGWAGQSVAQLDEDITRLVAVGPPHVSVYALTVEDGTPLAALQRAGRQVAVSGGLQPALDERCTARLGEAGYERYEVSNFARPGQRSRHNQVYWADRSYLGLGPGAASSIHPHRWVNRADLPGYLAAAREGRPLRTSAELVSPASRLVEVLGVGLRTRDGLEAAAIDRRFGPGVADDITVGGEALVAAGLLDCGARAGGGTGSEGGAGGGLRIRIPEACLSRADAIVAELIVALSRVERRARVLPV